MSNDINLDGKVVVITGAAGGLGKALIKKFLNEGCNIAAIVRSSESSKMLSKEFNSKCLSVHIADVANPEQVQKAFDEILERYGKVEFLFNNAAVYPRINFLDESPRQYLDAITINIGGVANCAKSVLSAMIKQGFGRIYNLSSFADLAPIADSAAYSCSKGAIHGLTKAIAADIAGLNVDIEVHEWNPGHIKTAMSDYTGTDPEISAGWAVEIASGKVVASKKSTLFCENQEFQSQPSLKRRLLNKLLFWKQSA